MNKSTRRAARTAAATLAAVCLTAAAGTGTAAAGGNWQEIPVGTNAPATLSGTLSVTNGSQTVSCPVLSGSGFGGWSVATNAYDNAAFQGSYSQRTCSNGQPFGMRISAALTEVSPGNWRLSLAANDGTAPTYQPFTGGTYNQNLSIAGPFINGTGGTASKVTFTDALISWGGIKVSGTLNLTRPGGGTLTIQ